MDKAYNLEQDLVKTQIDNEIMKNTSKDNIKSIQNDDNDTSLDWLCKRIVNSGIEVLFLSQILVSILTVFIFIVSQS